MRRYDLRVLLRTIMILETNEHFLEACSGKGLNILRRKKQVNQINIFDASITIDDYMHPVNMPCINTLAPTMLCIM